MYKPKWMIKFRALFLLPIFVSQSVYSHYDRNSSLTLSEFNKLVSFRTGFMKNNLKANELDAIELVLIHNTLLAEQLTMEQPYEKFNELFMKSYLGDITYQLNAVPAVGMGYYIATYDLYIGGRDGVLCRYTILQEQWSGQDKRYLNIEVQTHGNCLIDTNIVLGAFENQVLQLDSAQFVWLYVGFDDRISNGTDYNADSISYYENRLANRLELSDIDTLFIYGFLETYNIADILMKLKKIGVLYILGYGGHLQVLGEDEVKSDQIHTIQIVNTGTVELDLSVFDLLGTRTLIVDALDTDRKKSITISNTSKYLDQLIFELYFFPGFNRFVRKQRLQRINEQIKIYQTSLEYPWPTRPVGSNPHGRKL